MTNHISSSGGSVSGQKEQGTSGGSESNSPTRLQLLVISRWMKRNSQCYFWTSSHLSTYFNFQLPFFPLSFWRDLSARAISGRRHQSRVERCKRGGEKERAQGGEPGVTGAEVKMLAQMLGPSRRMRLLEADSWLEAGWLYSASLLSLSTCYNSL